MQYEYLRTGAGATKDDAKGEKILALGGVSFDISEGEFVAIAGKNGSGKSTLAKCLNALLLPTSGEVIIAGMDTRSQDDVFDIRQQVGMVFQNPDNQIVSSIVEDDVAFGPENLGVAPKEIRARVSDALEAVDMTKAAKKSPHLLSGGQKQRIAIAGVIAMLPSIIVLDEPTAMLDPKGRQDIMDIIKELNGRGITIVLITHFMDEAAEADRMMVLDHGLIVKDAAPAEVFDDSTLIENGSVELPMTAEISEGLRSLGNDVPSNVITPVDLVTWATTKARYR